MRKKILTYSFYFLTLLTLVIYNFITKTEAEKYEQEYEQVLNNNSESLELFEELYAKEDSIVKLSNRINKLTNQDGQED
ncbi:hypothetical protein SAMN05421640_0005 [Ekhidna lutea]|uniref:Uncharacterized protein n=1 Tax=Ekhidna lutea TaxID=447679 RepID=A0A239MEH8_EKHLU|nr:hypothetical protein [Ekhidna lutea]SNT40593.1 hypothetical protein SAMN05421640_0005 [Ekhidna lutea]